MYLALELLGTIAFAISGAMVGIKAKMDLLGVTVLGMTTAVGGGITRDILIGVVPPTAFQKPIYAAVAAAVSVIMFFPRMRKWIHTNTFLFNLVDAIGLGVFTVVGVKAGVGFDNLFLMFFLGTVTGVGGGVIRDLFAMRKPMIFVRNFYASASMLGALLCIFLISWNETVAMIAGAALVVFLRIAAARFRWHLPKTDGSI